MGKKRATILKPAAILFILCMHCPNTWTKAQQIPPVVPPQEGEPKPSQTPIVPNPRPGFPEPKPPVINTDPPKLPSFGEPIVLDPIVLLPSIPTDKMSLFIEELSEAIARRPAPIDFSKDIFSTLSGIDALSKDLTSEQAVNSYPGSEVLGKRREELGGYVKGLNRWASNYARLLVIRNQLSCIATYSSSLSVKVPKLVRLLERGSIAGIRPISVAGDSNPGGVLGQISPSGSAPDEFMWYSSWRNVEDAGVFLGELGELKLSVPPDHYQAERARGFNKILAETFKIGGTRISNVDDFLRASYGIPRVAPPKCDYRDDMLYMELESIAKSRLQASPRVFLETLTGLSSTLKSTATEQESKIDGTLLWQHAYLPELTDKIKRALELERGSLQKEKLRLESVRNDLERRSNWLSGAKKSLEDKISAINANEKTLVQHKTQLATISRAISEERSKVEKDYEEIEVKEGQLQSLIFTCPDGVSDLQTCRDDQAKRLFERKRLDIYSEIRKLLDSARRRREGISSLREKYLNLLSERLSKQTTFRNLKDIYIAERSEYDTELARHKKDSAVYEAELSLNSRSLKQNGDDLKLTTLLDDLLWNTTPSAFEGRGF